MTPRPSRPAQRGARGYDAGKKIRGRKRPIGVAPLGLLWKRRVLPGDIQDPEGTRKTLPGIKRLYRRLTTIWADGRYGGSRVAWVKAKFSCDLEVVKRAEGGKGFVVLPKRGIVERTLAWLIQNRRLSKDYESTRQSSEAWIDVASIYLMVRRLATS
ncbi:MAG: transposase [Armatimonadetes bacterium]|nr:transposase [Armatimonadota bacterium]